MVPPDGTPPASRLERRLILPLAAGLIAAAALAADTAAVGGTVRLAGTPPKRPLLPVTDAACRSLHAGGLVDESVVVGRNGALRNVFVWIASGLPARRWPAPAGPVRLEQRGCRFEPHVFGLRAGQTLEIVNADPVLHNIHALPKRGRGFNAAMPPRPEPWSIERSLPAAEVMVKIRCDVHGWMSSWAGVVDHPFYAVTDDAGRYALSGVPAGRYELRFWHETFGVRSTTIVTKDGARAIADAVFEAKG